MTNRTIKFRAWNKRLKQMFTVYSIDFDAGLVFCESKDDSRHTFGMIDVELLQFTESQDENEADIYQGDIWKRDTFISTVEFKNSQWALIKTDSSGCYQYPSFYSNADTGEVIGNIYENRELTE